MSLEMSWLCISQKKKDGGEGGDGEVLTGPKDQAKAGGGVQTRKKCPLTFLIMRFHHVLYVSGVRHIAAA